ncbi:MAG: hypothetical protein JW860_00290 [Sedimentisphaerales bacterium]|nr:hypothetical protein [Sedimentisphaerales bacterium]
MAFELNDIAPWGRSFDEYVRMFDLTDDDLKLRIISCGDGPAGFNSRMKRRGCRVISCDPIYEFAYCQLRERIRTGFDEVIAQTRKNRDNFVWDTIRSVEELGRIRMAAMEEFLADYEVGREEGRYLPASLPQLPFAGRQFDLALCSHFLFLYTGQLTLEFHQRAILEMCRVAGQVRIFPLVDLDINRSAYIEPIISEFEKQGLCVEIRHVPYEFQRGGNQMMIIF